MASRASSGQPLVSSLDIEPHNTALGERQKPVPRVSFLGMELTYVTLLFQYGFAVESGEINVFIQPIRTLGLADFLI